MSNSITFIVEGDVNTQITVTEVEVNGQIVLQFDVTVLSTTGNIGDLRALYFDLESFDADAAGNALIITAVEDSYDDIVAITDTEVAEEDVSTLGQDTNMNGSAIKQTGEFDVGIEFGTKGMSSDDIRSASFQLSLDSGEDLSLEMLNLSDFGIRYTSVGVEDGSRDDSSKIVEVDAAAIARNDTNATDEDTPLNAGGPGDEEHNLLFNDTIQGSIKEFYVNGTTFAAGTTAELAEGDLTINADGSYSFNPTPDYDGPVPVATYTVTNANHDTATANLVITINSVNDAAVITGAASATIVEDASPNTVGGNLDHTDVDGNNVDDVFQPVITGTATANGYGTYTVTTAGEWVFTLDNGNTAVDALDPGDTLTDTFTVLAEDGTPQLVTITIQGANDAAVITGAASATIVEDASPNTVGGNLDHTDVDGNNVDDVFQPVITGTATANGYGTYTVTTAGEWVFTLDNGNTAVDALDPGDTLTDTFTVLAEDGTPQLVTITIQGANDAAVITGAASATIVEDASPNTVGGNLDHTDVDGNNVDDVFQPVITGTATANGYGTYTVTTAGEWVFTLDNGNTAVDALDPGDTLTDTFTVLAEDGTPQLVTITIQGANDAAVITGAASATIVEDASPNTVGGNLDHTDVDGNNVDDVFQPVITGTATANGYGTYTVTTAGEWVFTLDNGNTAVDALDPGDTLTDTFTVLAEDGTPQLVTITIQGANDAAVITGAASATIVEDASPNTVGGNLDHTDVDGNNVDDVFQPVITGTATANGYGTYTVTTAGEWVFTLDNGNTAVDALDPGDTLTDTFTVLAEDGTPQLVTITIQGANDAAVITGAASATIVEDASPNTVGGNLDHTDVDGNNVDDVFQPVITGTATANGYGTYTVTTAGEWVFTLDNGNTAVDALDPGDTLTDTFTVLAEDGTPQLVTITIQGANDAAVITGAASATIVEDASPNTVGGNLDHTDVDGNNVDDVFQPVITGTATANGYGTYTVTTAGEWVFTLDNGNTAVDALDPGDTLTDTFTVLAEDGTPQLVTITIQGANDAAVITGAASATIVEDASPNTVGGNLDHTDVDGNNVDDVFQPVITGTATANGYGTYTVTTAGEWVFTLDNGNTAVDALDPGDTLTDTFTVLAEDGTPQLVTITIQGANDAAVITGAASATIVEDASPNTVGGNLDHTDVDGNNVDDVFQPVITGTATANGYGTYTVTTAGEWVFTLDNGNTAVDALDPGDTLTDTFTVLAEDGTPQLVTITIQGANDAAVITGAASATIVEDASPNTVGGNLDHTDVDGNNVDDVFQPVITGTATANGYGTYTVTTAGEWVFTLDNGNTAVDALDPGDTLTDTFTVLAEDGTPQLVTITIQGANDAAVITGAASATIVEDASPNTVGGNLDHTDVDGNNVDDVFQPVITGTATANGYGTYTVTTAGEWVFTLDNGNTAVDALDPGDTLTDTFTVLAEDGTPQLVTITIQGANDAAVITGAASATIVEDASPNTVGGNLDHTDVDGNNVDDVFQPVITGTATANGYGTYTVTTAGEWVFTLDNGNTAVDALDPGDTLTDTFTVLAEDGTPQLVTITIQGANDAAVITGAASATIVEDASPNTVGGNLDHTDVDGNNVDDVFQPVITGTATANGYGTYTVTTAGEWVFTLDNGNTAVDALDPGDTLTDTFTVLAEDGTPQLVTITIQGANDAAVITGAASATIVEDASPNTVGGNLDHTDVDGNNVDDVFQPVITGTATANGYGTYTVTTAGEWVFTLDNGNTAVDALDPGDTLTDTFTVLAEDGTPQLVTITIQGANDGGPSVSGNEIVQLDDEAAGTTYGPPNPGGTGDVSPDTEYTTGTLGFDFGSDGAGSVEWLSTGVIETGGATGFTYDIDVDGNLLVMQDQGGLDPVTVLTLTLVSATGAYEVIHNAPILHADGAGENDQSFEFTYRVTDLHDVSVEGTLTVDVDDDSPEGFTAQSMIVSNEAPLVGTGELNFFESIGADGGTVVFSGGTDGDTLYLADGATPVTALGATVTLHGYGTDTLTGRITVDGVTTDVFTVTLNPDSTVEANDTYTVEFLVPLDDGSVRVVEGNDLQGSNANYRLVDDTSTADLDLLFSASASYSVAGGYGLPETVNTSKNQIGIESGPRIEGGEVLRIDFVHGGQTTSSASNAHAYTGHYDVNAFSFGIGPQNYDPGATVTIRAFKDTDVEPGTTTTTSTTDLTNDPQVQVTRILVNGVEQNLSTLTQVNEGGVIVYTLDVLEGDKVQVFSDNGYNRIELQNETLNEFGVVDLSYSIAGTGAPQPLMDFGLTATDSDGDTATGTLNLTTQSSPDIIGTADGEALVGGDVANSITGGGGGDLMTGGGAGDTFIFLETSDTGVGSGVRDVITDFTSGSDVIDLSWIDADTVLAGEQAFLYGGQNTNVIANSVTYYQDGTVTIIQGDVNGDTTADFQIELTGLLTLDPSDFLL